MSALCPLRNGQVKYVVFFNVNIIQNIVKEVFHSLDQLNIVLLLRPCVRWYRLQTAVQCVPVSLALQYFTKNPQIVGAVYCSTADMWCMCACVRVYRSHDQKSVEQKQALFCLCFYTTMHCMYSTNTSSLNEDTLDPAENTLLLLSTGG